MRIRYWKPYEMGDFFLNEQRKIEKKSPPTKKKHFKERNIHSVAPSLFLC